MPRASNNLTTGFFALNRGMNSGVVPSLIRDDQDYFTINVTHRRGFPRTRPKFMKITLDFQGEEEVEEWFRTHPITGSSYYLPPSKQELLVCAAGGRFFSVQVNDRVGIVREVTPAIGRMSSTERITWFCQAAQFLVAQNGTGAPFIFDGSTGRYSDIANNEVPVGKQMAYVNNRLFVVAPNGREILPGDLAAISSDSVLKFNEILLPATEGGQPLSLPLEAGEITTLIPTAQLDTQYGQGILLACTATSICSFNPIIQRLNWDQIQLQNIALIGNGFTSDGCAIVNGDVWGRSMDGWRSFVMARRDFSTWGNTPQSTEVQVVLANDSQNLLDHADFVYFDNRLLGTVSPVDLAFGVYHRGLVALDFENISGLGDKTVPAYEGVWSGIQPYSLMTGQFKNQERCMAFCYSEQGGAMFNELWEVTKEFGDDDDQCRIACSLETKSYNFDKPIIWKSLVDFELWIDQLRGVVDFDIKYRPDQFPCWFDWAAFTECSKINNCEDPLVGNCQTPVTYEAQYRPRIELGLPPQNACTPVLNTRPYFGYEYQIRIAWTGNVRLKAGILYAVPKDINPSPVRRS